jgi:regulator of replication initiation timing
MAKQAVARTSTTDLDPIDRLEDKIKLLVDMVSQLRGEQTRATEENTRLAREIEALRARLTDAEAASSELAALRDERDVIRTRVVDMLSQLESL